MGLTLPEKHEHHSLDEWIIILGGSGAVGQFAVQLAKVCGYKVLTSCSPANEGLVKSLGADAVINYKTDLATQLSQVKTITGGNYARVFDTSAASTAAAMAMLADACTAEKKYFATTDDWSDIAAPENTSMYRCYLGSIGRSGEEDIIVANEIAGFIPKLEALLASGAVKPMKYHIAGHGFESIAEAVKVFESGSLSGTKCIVKVQDE